MPEPRTLFYRTEDLDPDEVLDYYVETPGDQQIIAQLKSRVPVVLRGSRGVGKSFLLRVAQAELRRDFDAQRVLPVYVTFSRAALLRQTPSGFLPWMTARISAAIKRALTSYGLAVPPESTLFALAGRTQGSPPASVAESVMNDYEAFWQQDATVVAGAESLPDSDDLREAVEDLCEELGLTRINLLVDEAAHVFVPEQQRQFFTLMRDLRSPRLAVKAAVYPGVTSYGPSFQPTHDATVVDVERSVSDAGYAVAMRDIVLRQVEPGSAEARTIAAQGEVFDVLAYAAMGNPRVLLKTYDASSRPFNRSRVQDTIRNYYREDVWSEHSSLAERYPGHRELVDWGRSFVERDVLPALHARNEGTTEASSAIWIHRDAPQTVKESLNLLCYSGILQEGVSGIRATRSEVGTRYIVNFGCNVAQDADPLQYGANLRRTFSIKRMQEFGANHSAFKRLDKDLLGADDGLRRVALETRMKQPLDLLDLTGFQKSKLRELGLQSIGDVIEADEAQFRTLRYVGQVRSRQMRNAAVTAVIEYLSG
jgi:hypothetical protein